MATRICRKEYWVFSSKGGMPLHADRLSRFQARKLLRRARAVHPNAQILSGQWVKQ
jgi:hypothetical protein